MQVIRLVPAKLSNFLEARVLYDKCIENELLSYPSALARTCLTSVIGAGTPAPHCAVAAPGVTLATTQTAGTTATCQTVVGLLNNHLTHLVVLHNHVYT